MSVLLQELMMPYNRKLTDSQIEKVFFSKRPYREIAEIFGISPTLVFKIKKGLMAKELKLWEKEEKT